MVDLVEPTFIRLRKMFRSNKTRPLEWRKGQLRSMITGLNEMKEELCQAIYEDLGRDVFLSEMCEIMPCISSAEWDLKNID